MIEIVIKGFTISKSVKITSIVILSLNRLIAWRIYSLAQSTLLVEFLVNSAGLFCI